jgi:hypothetical protein
MLPGAPAGVGIPPAGLVLVERGEPPGPGGYVGDVGDRRLPMPRAEGVEKAEGPAPTICC